jgi:hypothetical protein
VWTFAQEECRTIVFVIDGTKVPLRVEVNSLRQALGLPRFDLTNLENFQETAVSPPSEDISDEDHRDQDSE